MKSKISFIREKQLTGSYCGPAVIKMLASGVSVDIGQEALVDACESRNTVMKEGIPLSGLAKGLKRLCPDLVLWQKMDSKVDDISNLLEEGYKVGFDWQGIFNSDEYGDDEEDKWHVWLDKLYGTPALRGTQGHYCVALEVNKKKGYLRFADPYGHYAGKDRFVAIWEFGERWWDDRIDRSRNGKGTYLYENRMMFLVAQKGDNKPATMGMVEV